MKRVALGRTGIDVSDLCLGGNVFGWSANEAQSHDVLSAYCEAGGNFVDTADMYSEWQTGNVGGESESIIGSWMTSRGNRSDIVIATKVAKLSTRPGLKAENILRAAEESLKRLGTDYIDLYYAHEDDTNTPLAETLTAFNELITQGKVRFIGASNYTADRLAEALDISRELGIAEYLVAQPQYNAIVRNEYEGALHDLCTSEKIACVPYYALASGFLTGKYTPGAHVDSVRADGMDDFQTDRGWAIVDSVRTVAYELDIPMSAVALQWLREQPGVASPIASARTVEQLRELVTPAHLSAEHISLINSL